MLENLSRLLKAKGLLNSKIINDAESTPRVQSYKNRFGSLIHAYELIDYRPKKKFANAAAKRRGNYHVAEIECQQSGRWGRCDGAG
jgi:hypothetical protein